MLELYKGIKIEDEVIIVEKQNKEHQGYLVSVNNEKQLETALHWAKTVIYDENIYEEYRKVKFGTPQADLLHEKYLNSRKELEGIVHRYKNGQFKLALCESAERSWSHFQNGKLSFWNCLITCPDNKTFLVGINSECLLSLLKSTDFIKGVCQSNLWLGRIKNNVGAFTEDMDEFKDGKKDAEMREAKQTSNYNAVGQIIKTKSDAFIYLGEYYKNFNIYSRNSYNIYRNAPKYPEFFINVYTKPKKVHCYLSIINYKNEVYSDEDINNCYLVNYNFQDSKKKGILEDINYNIDINRIFNNTLSKYGDNEDLNTHWNAGYCDPGRALRVYNNSNEYQCPKELFANRVLLKKYTKEQADLNEFIELFKSRGGEVRYDLDIPKEDIGYYDGLTEEI